MRYRADVTRGKKCTTTKNVQMHFMKVQFKRIVLTLALYTLAILVLFCMNTTHIHPQNRTLLDPIKLFLPFCPERAATNIAKTICILLSVAVSATQLFIT